MGIRAALLTLRTVVLALFGLVLRLVLLNGIASTAEPARIPNVILADDLGWADLTPYGSTFHDTPNLKRLADRSVRFTKYYAASPLCSSTRSSILPGVGAVDWPYQGVCRLLPVLSSEVTHV